MSLDNFDLVQKVLSLPWYNLILISILLVPLFIGAWITLFNSMGVVFSDSQKRRVVLSIVVVYIIGLIAGKVGHDRTESLRYRKIATVLENDIKMNAPDFKVMGFRRLLFKHPRYDKELFFTIEEKYPETFTVVALTDTSDPVGLRLLK